MDQRQLPSLKKLIYKKIQRRVFLAMVILFSGAIFTSMIEAALSYSNMVTRLNRRASVLQDLVISEVLVNNRDATAAVLRDANLDSPGEAVWWIPPEKFTPMKIEPAIRWTLNGNWTFTRPLRTLGSQTFGALVFSGNFFTDKNLISILTHRVAYAVVICLIMGFLLLPLARRVPSDLILEPVHHLLSLVRSESGANNQRNQAKYQEIKALEDEFRNLMTQKRELEDERVEVQQTLALTRTAQMLAHDIRRPFSLMKAILDGLSQSTTPESVRELTEATLPSLIKSFSGLDDMLDELIMIGKPATTANESLDLSHIIQRGVEAAIALPFSHDARIKLNLTEGLWVIGTADHLRRVVTNLVANALQAMSPHDHLEIKSLAADGTATITVHNTGSYILPEEQQRIFQPFYTKGKAGGTGLGLAICKRIVSDHGGKLRFESTKDLGTSFFVSLPLAQSDKRNIKKGAVQPFPQSFKTLKILVADDQMSYRKAIVNLAPRLIVNSGVIEFTEVATGEEAISIVSKIEPDVIIIDINFGEGKMDGLSIVREFRRRNITSKICVHSNHPTLSAQQDAIAAGADLFVPKPISAESLRMILA